MSPGTLPRRGGVAEVAGLLAVPALAGAMLLLRGLEPTEVALAAGFSGAFWVLASVDLRSMMIPNRLVCPLLAAALVAAASGVWPGRGAGESLAGGVAALAAALAVRSLSRGGLGGGDVKMAALVGSVVGISALPLAALVAALSGGATAALLLVTRHAQRGARLPYGPFVAAGGIAALLC